MQSLAKKCDYKNIKIKKKTKYMRDTGVSKDIIKKCKNKKTKQNKKKSENGYMKDITLPSQTPFFFE